MCVYFVLWIDSSFVVLLTRLFVISSAYRLGKAYWAIVVVDGWDGWD